MLKKLLFIIIFNTYLFGVTQTFNFDCHAMGTDGRNIATIVLPPTDDVVVNVDIGTANNCVFAYTDTDVTPLHSGATPASQYTIPANGTGTVNVYKAGVGGYNWSFTRSASAVNGSCGTSLGQVFTSVPFQNLCASGNAITPVVNNPNTYDWNCSGVNGGTTAPCHAYKPTSILSANIHLTLSNVVSKTITAVEFIDLRVDENLTFPSYVSGSMEANRTLTHNVNADRFVAIKLTTSDNKQWLYGDTNITLLNSLNFNAPDFNTSYGFSFSSASPSKNLNLVATKWSDFPFHSIINFETNLTNYPELGFNTIGTWLSVGGESNGDPGNWNIEGTNGAVSIGMNTAGLSYDGVGDATYNSIYFTDFNSTNRRLVNVTFDVIQQSSGASGITVYGYKNNQLIQTIVGSFTTTTINGVSEKLFSPILTGVDELRFLFTSPIGFDNFVLQGDYVSLPISLNLSMLPVNKTIQSISLIDLRVDYNETNSTLGGGVAHFFDRVAFGLDKFYAIKLVTSDAQEWLYSDTNITLLSDANFSATDFNATFGFNFSNAGNIRTLDLADVKWSDYNNSVEDMNITLSFLNLASHTISNIEILDLNTNSSISPLTLNQSEANFTLSSNTPSTISIITSDGQSWLYSNAGIINTANVNYGAVDFNLTYRFIFVTGMTQMVLDLADVRWGNLIISPTPIPNAGGSGGDSYVDYPVVAPPPNTQPNVNINNENVNIQKNPDGSQIIGMQNPIGNFEALISKDGSINANFQVGSGNQMVKTDLNFAKGTQFSVNKSGAVEFSMKLNSGSSMALTPKSDGSGVKSSVKLPNGKAIDIAVPSGAKVTMDEKGLKQEFETKEGKTNVTFTPDGKMNVSIQSSDGKSININSTVEAEISVNNDGSITQIMDLGEMVATVVASKRAEIKGSFESKDGSKTDVNAPKGSNVTASEDEVSISSADSSYLTNLDVKTDGSVEIEIGSTARADRESIKYSSRAGASDIKAKVLFPNQTSLRRVGASGRAEVEYSMRGAIANSLNRSDSTITITPKEQIAVKETIGFDGASSIETNGTASLNGSLDDKSFNMSNSDCVTLNSDGSFEASKESNDTTAKLSSDSSGNLNIKLEFDNKNRALSSRESFSYSPRRGISDLKVDVIMGDTNRRVDSDRVNLEYSSARRLIFETIQRDSSKIEIVPNSDAKFEENIYMDTNRTIKLIVGSSQIVINGESQAMILNQEYQLPNIETELDSSYKSKTIQTKTTLKEGWNLIGSPITSDITDPFIFGNFDTIWLYDGGTWYKNPDSISYHLGFWIKANESNDVNFSGTTYLSDLTSFSDGWSLIAVGDGFESNKTLKDYHIESAWKYENQTYTEIKSLDSLSQGSGAWIKREQPTATLSIEKGWNLKSPPTIEDINDTSIFKDFDFIYVYRDSKWVENPNSIKSGEGFWIYSYVAQELPFYSQTYDANLSDLNGTIWNLKGGYINNANSTGREIWVYRYGNWFSNKLNNLTTVNSGDGFFVK